ncbi:MAG: pyridoxal phosphate-dependent aminotransferase [Acidimicrobiales bacterium]
MAPYDPGPSVAELEERFGVSGLVKLNWNEDLFGLLPGVAEAVAEQLGRASQYPGQAYRSFRELVAASAGAEPAMVVAAHGIQSLVLATAAVFLEPGDRVVLPAPTYGLYRQACSSAGAEVVSVPTRGYRIDTEAMLEAAEGAKLMFVCDPNNPTGDALSPEEWHEMVTAVPDGCAVVVDEAYADYMPKALRPDRVADVAAGKPVVVLRTFSKLFGIAGLRLGYALMHPDLVACFDAVQEPFNVNRLALAAGTACLRDPETIELRRLEVVGARERFAKALAGIGVPCITSQANFVLARPGGDDQDWYEGLVRDGFVVRPGSDFGLAGHLRITVGPSGLMDAVVSAMERVRQGFLAPGSVSRPKGYGSGTRSRDPLSSG